MKNITTLEALEALDSLDDICRMGGVTAIGPINTLLDFIEQTWAKAPVYDNTEIKLIIDFMRATNK